MFIFYVHSFLHFYLPSPGLLFAAAGTGFLDGITSKPLEMIKLRQQILPAITIGTSIIGKYAYARTCVQCSLSLFPSCLSYPFPQVSINSLLFLSSFHFSPPLSSFLYSFLFFTTGAGAAGSMAVQAVHSHSHSSFAQSVKVE